MNRYLDGLESIWHEDVMNQLSALGLERKSIMRIWNHKDQYKLGILWEYSTPQAFQECQKVISAHILPHAHKFEMVARSLRGVPVVDWRRDDAGFTRNDRTATQTTSGIEPSDIEPGGMEPAGDVGSPTT